MTFEPGFRPRRLRRTPGLRSAFAEASLDPSDLIAPLFIKEGIDEPVPIVSMPGHFQQTLESAAKEARELSEMGIAGFLLFGIPEHKDAEGTGAWDDDGIVPRAIRTLKDDLGESTVVLGDVCMCEYTDHGHCGILTSARDTVDNDVTLERYGRIAVSQARAGADLVAPSGMMDGQVGAVRAALDAEGFHQTGILSYACKFASSFYGPFREAAEGAPQFGDRRTYQMDPANASEAIREAELDASEGADALMVKPALAYLDILSLIKDRTNLPMTAYNVSGEYSMVVAAAERGWIDERQATLEVLTSIRRAGADLVITYSARKAAEWLG